MQHNWYLSKRRGIIHSAAPSCRSFPSAPSMGSNTLRNNSWYMRSGQTPIPHPVNGPSTHPVWPSIVCWMQAQQQCTMSTQGAHGCKHVVYKTSLVSQSTVSDDKDIISQGASCGILQTLDKPGLLCPTVGQTRDTGNTQHILITIQ